MLGRLLLLSIAAVYCRPSVGKEHARTLLAAALSQLYGTEPRTDAAHPTLSAAAKHHVQPAMGRQALE